MISIFVYIYIYFPIGNNIFPIPYRLFPIGYSLFPIETNVCCPALFTFSATSWITLGTAIARSMFPPIVPTNWERTGNCQ